MVNKNFSKIKIICYDFDGVMTNNKVYVDQYGKEMVQVNRADGLGVEEINNFPLLSRESQAHPEPNLVAAALENSVLKFSNDPNAAFIASASSPEGSPPPFGDITSQNKQ